VQVLLGLILVAGLGVGAYAYMSRPDPTLIEKPLTTMVSKGPFEYVVLEQGEIESSSNVEIRCEVKSRGMSGITIIDIVPEGTVVEKGDLLVKLDSTALDQEQIQQQIACNTAEATMIQSKNTFEAAKIAKTEYLEATFKQEEQLVLSEVFVAEQNASNAKLAYDSTLRLALRGIVTSLQLEGDKFAMDKARKDLEAANIKLEGLRKYTKEKMLKQLDSDIASAEAKWKADQKSFELETAKLRDIEDQIAKCTIKAPRAGQVTYVNKFSGGRSAQAEFVVEPGAIVREQQPIIRLPDSNAMQVKATINESRVNAVRTGMPVAIRVEALRDEMLQGKVTKVNQYPEPLGWGSTVKKYATFVQIDDPPAELRAGMNAEVRIYVERLPDALQVPVQAIAEHKQKFFCLVETAAGLETRPIENGPSNDKSMVILAGLQPGEHVVLDPRSRPELEFPKLPDPTPVAETVTPTETTPVVLKDGPKGEKGEKGRGGQRGPGNGPPSAADLVARWLEADANKDGKLQASEVESMDERARRGMSEADANKDSEIDKAEMTAAAGKAVIRIRQFMQQQGGGGPGGNGPPSGGGQ
jgi:RND family efflux transporter MFP subunit